MRSIYYKELEKIYVLSYLSGRKECYCDGIFFIMPLDEYFTYRRLGMYYFYLDAIPEKECKVRVYA